ncbi:MAG: Ribosomal large subunit pseudouridine synthase D (EC [uncultured Thiotrichaceae bacterium]|uniref:Pseudouridine synthase n=1 Tax=uncultured Thiotrichaceae bacterium TaxID=298394 RepID=A0A6S6UJA9_9GAMM|nr:MAG: Ribosomal large subunit pseudouridine synthase D (EC [uncultured Thiotrichaceae bacterium]
MLTIEIPFEMRNKRLDQVLAKLCPEYSRSQLQRWIKSGNVTLNGKPVVARYKTLGAEIFAIEPVDNEPLEDLPEDIPLDIMYEDEHIMVINKTANLVVHPGAGNRTGTIVNGLLHHNAEQKHLPRAGIVHRLDKDTTGLMVIAKSMKAHKSLVDQLQERSVKREYLALAQGNVISGDTIEGNIGRHPVDRKKMAVVDGGKTAITHYRVERRFVGHTLLRVNLETGRTHQIRVHLSWKHYPIVGDTTYQGRPRIPKEVTVEAREAVQQFPRQALHATKLSLVHPDTAELMSWAVDMPADMYALMDTLEEV